MTEQLAENLNDSLDDVFEDSPVEIVTEPIKNIENQEVPKVEPETKVEEKTEGQTEPEAKSEPENTDSKQAAGLKAALTAERKKRQALQKQIDDSKEKDLIPDRKADPQGYTNYLEGKTNSIELKTRIEMSSDVMREAHDDFETYENKFLNMVATTVDGVQRITNEALLNRYNQSKNPAKFAYDEAKKHESYLEKADPDYEKKLRDKIAKELVENMKGMEGKISATELSNFTSSAAASGGDKRVELAVDPYKIDAYDD